MRNQVLNVLVDDGGSALYPPDHKFAMEVPNGGSSCAKCRFVSEDRERCSNRYFLVWNQRQGARDPGSLPKAATRYCCDDFEAG